MTEISEGRKLHKQALDAQEDEKYAEALRLIDNALVEYANSNDTLSFAEIHALRSSTCTHLFRTTKFRGWLTAAKFSAMIGVEVATDSGNRQALGIPLYHLAKIQDKLGEFGEAHANFDEALAILSTNPPEIHGSDAVLADVELHKELSHYRAGDHDALSRALGALSKLENSKGGTERERRVWISGGHLRLAEFVYITDPKAAEDHLSQARAIIEADPMLKIRKQELDLLAETFKS